MEGTLTYKEIVAFFAQIAYHHEQIKSFGVGDVTQVTMDVNTKQEPEYTRMYVIPEGVEFNQNHLHYNFAVIIADKVEDDLSNLQEAMSDTLAICMDVWTVFWQSYTYEYGNFSKIIVGDWEPDTHPFTERFESTLAGWTMHIKLSAPFDYDRCDLPIIDNYGFPQDQTYSSYEQILVDWQNFADAHQQVQSWGFGDGTQLTMDLITKQEPQYPRMYFIPDRTRLNPNHMHVTWTVIVVDKIEEDLSNQVEVLSDTLEICKDFYAKAYLSDYDVEWDAALNPWLEDTESSLAGWSFTISVQQKFDYNRCVLPMTSFAEGITWEQLMQLWKLEAQKWNNVKRQN
jgi:hypothetical protein